MHDVAGARKYPAGRPGDLAEAGGVHDDHGAGILADQRWQLAEYAGAQDHLVGSLATDRNAGYAHRRASALCTWRAISSATSAAVLLSVPTVSQASSE